MTTRTEGLVTYTEETRVTKAVIDAAPVKVKVERGHDGLLYFTLKNWLEDVEARALRDAITVMLGEEPAVPIGAAVDIEQATKRDVAERIIGRLEAVKEWTKEDYDSSPRVQGKHFGMDEAIAIVREECGVAE